MPYFAYLRALFVKPAYGKWLKCLLPEPNYKIHCLPVFQYKKNYA